MAVPANVGATVKAVVTVKIVSQSMQRHSQRSCYSQGCCHSQGSCHSQGGVTVNVVLWLRWCHRSPKVSAWSPANTERELGLDRRETG